ncbi:tagaturonate epimerase family protein [Gracilinema caldarium]|uniref:tagaturonate epimerase family protein n=1 Tax=Gracilinema caldarium TaxID=215591 RepID=UPI0026EBE01C|nr:tagaturonate epimerase family protein [Gracilinema caldarium]
MKQLARFSMGIGDRFGHQGKAQLAALTEAKRLGCTIIPVWNKSYREHSIIHTDPKQVRREADEAVKALGWTEAYHVDADHISLKTVDLFLDSSDFYTLDVADYTGKAADEASISRFVAKYRPLIGNLAVPGIGTPLQISEESLYAVARKYLLAVQEAGKLYRHIAAQKGAETFITEVSMDETDLPQKPEDLFFILAMIADEKIPAQTIAPKFSGRFNKGVDYTGDPAQFEREFNEDILVIAYAVKKFGLPRNLKLSVHSGSDKFSIYPAIKKALYTHNAGLHLKTAGTTWLEELIGLASAGGSALALAKQIYREAYRRFDELCQPYATVIDIRRDRLPAPETVDSWDGETYAASLRHVETDPRYNPDFRQLLHVGYKVAAELGETYLKALEAHEDHIGAQVKENLLDRHIRQIFIQ